MNVLARLDEFRGLSRFTTWAYKFVVFEVSGKVGRHPWRRQPPGRHEPGLERLPDSLARRRDDLPEPRTEVVWRAANGLEPTRRS